MDACGLIVPQKGHGPICQSEDSWQPQPDTYNQPIVAPAGQGRGG